MIQHIIYLKAWRTYRGLSQKELAEASGVPRPNLIAIENAQRDCTLKTWTKLARALKVKPGYMMENKPLAGLKLTRHEIDQLVKMAFGLTISQSSKILEVLPLVAPELSFMAQAIGLKNKTYSKKIAFNVLDKKLFGLIVDRANKIASNYCHE